MTKQQREALEKAHAEFHKHLDQCPRCEKNPFDLCARGARLLMAAADASRNLIVDNFCER